LSPLFVLVLCSVCAAQALDKPKLFHAETGWHPEFEGGTKTKPLGRLRPFGKVNESWSEQLSNRIMDRLQKTDQQDFIKGLPVCHVIFGISNDGYLTHFKFIDKSNNEKFNSAVKNVFSSFAKNKAVPESSTNFNVEVIYNIEYLNHKFKIHTNSVKTPAQKMSKDAWNRYR